jgi:hypothetical protein
VWITATIKLTHDPKAVHYGGFGGHPAMVNPYIKKAPGDARGLRFRD